jgi:hypothetical protein
MLQIEASDVGAPKKVEIRLFSGTIPPQPQLFQLSAPLATRQSPRFESGSRYLRKSCKSARNIRTPFLSPETAYCNRDLVGSFVHRSCAASTMQIATRGLSPVY